ncbi:MAG TPA: hypothetical protein VF842_10300 [Flavobacterium sp.]
MPTTCLNQPQVATIHQIKFSFDINPGAPADYIHIYREIWKDES